MYNSQVGLLIFKNIIRLKAFSQLVSVFSYFLGSQFNLSLREGCTETETNQSPLLACDTHVEITFEISQFLWRQKQMERHGSQS